MAGAHTRAAMALATSASAPKPRAGAMAPPGRLPVTAAETKLRVLIAERRASAHSELSRRLDRVGHEVLARVTSGQGALDYAELLRPDVVLIAPVLEDGPGVMAAIALTRELPGVAAVVLSTHPAAANPAARPNWGAVALVPADAEPADLDTELRRAVAQAREAAAVQVVPEQLHHSTQLRPADLPPAVAPTPQYQTPIPDVAQIAVARNQASPAPAVPAVPSDPARAMSAPAEPQVRAAAVPPSPPADQPRPRSPLSFTDEDLLAIGPALDTVSPAEPVASPAVPAQPSASAAAPVYAAAPAAVPVYDADSQVIAEAAECLLERTGLSRSDAMRLMEQEAADTGQSLAAVARSVLSGGDGATATPEAA